MANLRPKLLEIEKFDRIAQTALKTISDHDSSTICTRLAEGVSYIYQSGIVGDIAEFGTMTGKTAVALSARLEACGELYSYCDKLHGYANQRSLHLFDSFEGLPTATYAVDQKSLHVRTGVWNKGSCQGLTAEELHTLCTRYIHPAKLHVVKGWFKETVPNAIKDPLAMIHVDGDLYESCMDALLPLLKLKKISPGAIIFFDDFNCNQASNLHGERKAWAELTNRFEIEFSDQGSYGTFGHAFIVHSYYDPPAPDPLESEFKTFF